MISKQLYKFSNILSFEVEGQSHFQKRRMGAAPPPPKAALERQGAK